MFNGTEKKRQKSRKTMETKRKGKILVSEKMKEKKKKMETKRKYDDCVG